jgi:hypothetical protein
MSDPCSDTLPRLHELIVIALSNRADNRAGAGLRRILFEVPKYKPDH